MSVDNSFRGLDEREGRQQSAGWTGVEGNQLGETHACSLPPRRSHPSGGWREEWVRPARSTFFSPLQGPGDFPGGMVVWSWGEGGGSPQSCPELCQAPGPPFTLVVGGSGNPFLRRLLAS